MIFRSRFARSLAALSAWYERMCARPEIAAVLADAAA
jgi:hypothetical protein